LVESEEEESVEYNSTDEEGPISKRDYYPNILHPIPYSQQFASWAASQAREIALHVIHETRNSPPGEIYSGSPGISYMLFRLSRNPFMYSERKRFLVNARVKQYRGLCPAAWIDDPRCYGSSVPCGAAGVAMVHALVEHECEVQEAASKKRAAARLARAVQRNATRSKISIADSQPSNTTQTAINSQPEGALNTQTAINSQLANAIGVRGVPDTKEEERKNMEEKAKQMKYFHYLQRFTAMAPFALGRVFSENGFLYGKAGYLCGALELRHVFNDTAHINDQLMIDLIKRLFEEGRSEMDSIKDTLFADVGEEASGKRLQTAIDHGGFDQVAKPVRLDESSIIYPFQGVSYLGSSNGLAGVLMALLSCPRELLDAANGTWKFEISAALSFLIALARRPGSRREYREVYVPDIDAQTHAIVGRAAGKARGGWCHGAAGAVILLCRAYEVIENPTYLKEARLAAEQVWKRALSKKGPGLCHGVAGNGYALLAMYRVTKGAEQTKWMSRAGALAKFVCGVSKLPNFDHKSLQNYTKNQEDIVAYERKYLETRVRETPLFNMYSHARKALSPKFDPHEGLISTTEPQLDWGPEKYEDSVMQELEYLRLNSKYDNFTNDGFLWWGNANKNVKWISTIDIKGDEVTFEATGNKYKLFHPRNHSNYLPLDPYIPGDEEKWKKQGYVVKEMKEYGDAFKRDWELSKIGTLDPGECPEIPHPKDEEEAMEQAGFRERFLHESALRSVENATIEELDAGYEAAGCLPHALMVDVRRRFQMIAMDLFNETLPLAVEDTQETSPQLLSIIDEFQDESMMKPDRPYSLFEGLSGLAMFLSDVAYPQGARFPLFQPLDTKDSKTSAFSIFTMDGADSDEDLESDSDHGIGDPGAQVSDLDGILSGVQKTGPENVENSITKDADLDRDSARASGDDGSMQS